MATHLAAFFLIYAPHRHPMVIQTGRYAGLGRRASIQPMMMSFQFQFSIVEQQATLQPMHRRLRGRGDQRERIWWIVKP